MKGTESERFWSKVQKTDGCWIWTGGQGHGYGRFSVACHQTISAHRYAYQTLVAEVAPGKEVDHICKNRACVNPGHLEVVTHKENLLRADTGFAAVNKRKTHCPSGHPYSEENTHLRGGNWRVCKICRRDSRKRSVRIWKLNHRDRYLESARRYQARRYQENKKQFGS